MAKPRRFEISSEWGGGEANEVTGLIFTMVRDGWIPLRRKDGGWVAYLPVGALKEVFPLPPEPEPGAYTINGYYVIWTGAVAGQPWLVADDLGHDYFDWPSVWNKVGRSGVTSSRLKSDKSGWSPYSGACD